MKPRSADSRPSTAHTRLARERLLAVRGEPLVTVQWERVLFIHFRVEPRVVAAHLPGPFELELHDDRAVVSLVALTMRRFRPRPGAPLWGRLFRVLREQRFFNVRTYVRCGEEAGTFFFWSWLSRPLGLPLPRRPFGLTCAFGSSRYRHTPGADGLRGHVRTGKGRIAYIARHPLQPTWDRCEPGSLGEHALERYTGFFWHRGRGRVFRAWHPPWIQTPVEIEILEDTLVADTFPWLKDARPAGAHFAPGFEEVWLGRPHPLYEMEGTST